MRRTTKAILLVAALAATAVTATTVQAETAPPQAAPILVAAPPTAADTGGAITETTFVPITACRLYDTRQGQGGSQIGAGNFRILKVKGPENIPGQYSGQGGKAGGCGVPVAATAIEATVTAVSAAGTGLLRLWPSGSTETTSTFLNFMRGFNPTNTGALAICNVGCGAASDLRVRVQGAATHVVIEVQGYYVKPLAAVVQSTGTLSYGSRVVASTRTSTGTYLVQFDRPVDRCVGHATVDGSVSIASVTTGAGDATQMYVFTADAAGALQNRPFHLTVTC